MCEFSLIPLGQLAEIRMGQSPDSTYVYEGREQGIPFLQGNAEFGAKHPAAKYSCIQPAKIAEQGSSLISVRAPVGETNIADQLYCIGRGLAAVKFHHYGESLGRELLSFNAKKLDKVSQGTTFSAIGGADLRTLLVADIPVREAKILEEILDTLDTQIQKTEALIAKLEKVKEGLLHDLLTRGIDENGQLRPSPEQAPELYKDSPLGLIPREWRALSVGDCLSESPSNGYSPQEASEFSGKLMLGLGCLTQSGFLPIQLKNAPEKDALIDRALLRDGDLLISRANTRELVGLCGVYRDIGLPCSYPDLMMRLIPSSGVSSSFMELLLRHDRVRDQIKSSASGTSGSMVKISGSTLIRTFVFLPEKNEQEMILEQACRIAERLSGERENLTKMTWFKQGLMNDLLTGHVRVTPLLGQAQTPA
ncbi:MAG: hypothetical protein ACQETW_06670 [Pseudomonadota bacterium]